MILISTNILTFDGFKEYQALSFWDLQTKYPLTEELNLIVTRDGFEFSLSMKNAYSRDENNIICDSFTLEIL